MITLLENEVQKQRDLSVPYEALVLKMKCRLLRKIFRDTISIKDDWRRKPGIIFFAFDSSWGSTLEEMKHIERLCGKSEQEALKIASSVIADIENATRFRQKFILKVMWMRC